jgi:O-Antigen ligase
MISQHQHLSCAPVSPQLVVTTRRKGPPTTRVERLLLFLTILLLPLENSLPGVRGFSSLFFVFVISSIYVVTRRFGSLVHIWNHRVFLASYILIFISIVLETYSPFAEYKEIISNVQMFMGAIVVATLCRDIKALKLFIVGCILAGLLASFSLFLSVYGPLQRATATDFDEASRVRAEVFGDESLEKKLVNPASLSASIAPAAAATLAIALVASNTVVRYSFLSITAFCFVASFLPFSRGITAATLMACMAVVLAYGRANRGASFQRFIRIIAMIFVLGIGTLLLVPHAVIARLTVPSSTAYEDAADPRTILYNSAVAHLPEYWLVGVGAGNYWDHWGRRSGFILPGYHGVSGAHNAFVQLAIYWGLPSLLSLLSIMYYAYKCLPKKCGDNPLSLAILGFAVTSFVTMGVVHGIYSKSYSLTLGILVGTQYWIWPAGETQPLGRIVRKV